MGAISVRKVRGEVNPVDLFTKHLPSKDKVHQLLALFGCEYREGRAVTAPLLRPHGSEAVDPLPTFLLNLDAEMEIHDVGRLPYMHSEEEIEGLFPLIPAAPLQENVEDWEPTPEYSEATSPRPRTARRMKSDRLVASAGERCAYPTTAQR